MEDFNEVLPSFEEQHRSKLDSFKSIIDKWLIEDKKAPRKQRHTATRVHKRLQDEVEGYDCSYRAGAVTLFATRIMPFTIRPIMEFDFTANMATANMPTASVSSAISLCPVDELPFKNTVIAINFKQP